MGQSEIIELLEKEKRWMTIKEIVDKTKTMPSSVSSTLRRLYRFSEVLKKEVNQTKRTNRYKWKAK